MQKVVLLALGLPVLAALLVRALSWNGCDAHYRRQVWAAVLVGTPVLNLYIPLYDAVIAALGGLLLVDSIPVARQSLPGAIRWYLIAGHLSSWITQPFARQFHIQILTLVLLGLTVWICLWGFRSTSGERHDAIAADSGALTKPSIFDRDAKTA